MDNKNNRNAIIELVSPFPQIKMGGISRTMVGTTLLNLHPLIIDFAKQRTNVLFIGERGTGKEHCARAYQEASGKADFVPVNCAEITETVLQSELFGHKKGAFTDAKTDRKGLLAANEKKGVVFLDEIGDSKGNFQASILRVLQNGDYRPLGSDESMHLKDICLIAATSKPENIRDDLRDRFTCLYIPPLSDLRADIPMMVKAFLENLQSPFDKPKYISEMALEKLHEYHWPGNVRELKRVIETAVVLGKGEVDILTVSEFPEVLGDETDSSKKLEISMFSGGGDPLPKEHFLRPPQEPTAINFDNTGPKEYEKGFWEHHAKEGRGGADMARMFKTINRKTASARLKEARERMEAS